MALLVFLSIICLLTYPHVALGLNFEGKKQKENEKMDNEDGDNDDDDDDDDNDDDNNDNEGERSDNDYADDDFDPGVNDFTPINEDELEIVHEVLPDLFTGGVSVRQSVIVFYKRSSLSPFVPNRSQSQEPRQNTVLKEPKGKTILSFS